MYVLMYLWTCRAWSTMEFDGIFSCRLRNISEEEKKTFSDALLRRQNSIKKLQQFRIYDTDFFFLSFNLFCTCFSFFRPTTITNNSLIKLWKTKRKEKVIKSFFPLRNHFANIFWVLWSISRWVLGFGSS